MSSLNQDPRSGEPAETAGGASGLTACGRSVNGDAAVPSNQPRGGKAYWRSLDEYMGTPEFNALVEHEFAAAATAPVNEEERRHFIKIMGASFAFAGLTLAGCRRWPEQKIVPYAHRPENRDPGVRVEYATTCELGGVGTGLVVRSFDGRPIKIEGNALHPASLGATDLYAQASILDLYDADRSRQTWRGAEQSNWPAFVSVAGEQMAAMRADGGARVAVLSEASASPTMALARKRFMEAFPKASWYVYEPVNNDNERAGTAIAVGRPHRVVLRLAPVEEGMRGPTATTIVSLGADFLFDHPQSVRLMRELAQARRVPALDKQQAKQQALPRLYTFESGLSTTGMSSDVRAAVRSSDIPAIAAAIAAGVGVQAAGLDALAASASLGEAEKKIVQSVIDDLRHANGHSVVIAGRQQPPEVHALACLINQALGNIGETVTLVPDPDADHPGSIESITALARSIGEGRVETLIMLGTNPVYTAPADLDFGALLRKVPFSVHTGFYRDETAVLSTWHVPRPHFLECWGDSRSWDGTIAIQQPLIHPMIDDAQGGRSCIELVSLLAGKPESGEEMVRAAFASRANSSGAMIDGRWRELLHDGVEPDSAWRPSANLSVDAARVGAALGALANRAGGAARGLEVVFRPDSKLYDGRWSNNGWLQELPDPTTKVTWDNAAVMSPVTARELGVWNNDLVTLSVNGRTLDIAVYVLPGHADGSISLSLGYGRELPAGRIAEGAGFNTYRLRTTAAPDVATGASISKTGGTYTIVHVQDRGGNNPVAEQGRQERLPSLVREGTLDEFRAHPDFAKHVTHVAHRLSLWEESNLDGARHRWAMSIDLNACTGCSACVVACQAENNIPIVGKEQVRRGREMHWIRIDRYFRGPDASRPLGTSCIPVTCMHCENAPCEQVCPVAATVHDKEGLNVMVYNRCVGTRYCSNNCPYKVRRFNYFDWHRKIPARGDDWIQTDAGYYVRYGPDMWKRMQFNPDVTVRMRGIMEKCTYCTQRINEVRIDAKNLWAQRGGRDSGQSDYVIPDGAITPACAQACPAEAIVFGDLNDPESRVSKLHRSMRSYQMLEELNTKTRTQYLARVRNPGADGHDGHGHGENGSGHGAHS